MPVSGGNEACRCRKSGPHATWVYSWMSPPSRSRRMTLMSASTGSGSALSGLGWFSARCER
jgi:hypothetical protein